MHAAITGIACVAEPYLSLVILHSMPAGITWGAYLRFLIAAGLSMFAGSQVVHMLYRPLDDLDEYIEVEKKTLIAQIKDIESKDQKNIVKTTETKS